MGLIRLVIFGFIAMTVVYVLLSIYSRSLRREKLEKRWAEENPGGDMTERAAYVERGIEEYNSSARPKLLLLVYVVPTILVAAIHILTTYY
jgi:hypothetical protein